MIEQEWRKGDNYVRVEKRGNKTINKMVTKEIVVRIGDKYPMRSCHPYEEKLLAFFLDKLDETK